MVHGQKQPGKKFQTIGKLGEEIAKKYLIDQGYQILDTNYHTRQGEIDIVCRQGNALIFIEVKTRSNQLGGFPEEAVTPVKLQRINAAINHYLQNKKIHSQNIQIDVISIEFSQAKSPLIHHFKNIAIDY